MAVPFQNYDAAPFGAVTVTPADGVTLTNGPGRPFRGLYVGVTGNVSVRMLDGNTVVFTAVPAGTTLQIQFDQVHATNTTASIMLALY